MSILGHADRIVSSVPNEVRSAFISSPRHAVELLGLTARQVTQLQEKRGEGGWCDGFSFLEDGILLYVATPYSRRENFTLAHEAAHWLVDNDDDAVDWIADHPHGQVTLEQLCDHIAGKLLVPVEVLNSVVGDGPPRAAHLDTLYSTTNASEPACAIALTRRLSGIGAAVLIDLDARKVRYSSIVWDGFDGRPLAYPWKGQGVPTGHVLRTIPVGAERTVKSWWATTWGERHNYYLDAIVSTKRVFAIFSEHDLWHIENLHIDIAERRNDRPTQEVRCSCGFSGSLSGFPCNTCGKLFCPKCGSCACQRKFARDRPCTKCFTLTPPPALENDICSECR